MSKRDHNELRKMFAKPALTPKEIADEQLFAMTCEELARLPVDLPKHMRAAAAVLRALERHIDKTK
jgi:hypothetical protein